jgi:hypothetical protein
MLGEMITQLDANVGFDFLGAGNWLGLDAISNPEQPVWNYGATVMSRTEALEISVADLHADPELRKVVSEYFPPFSSVDDRPPQPHRQESHRRRRERDLHRDRGWGQSVGDGHGPLHSLW